MLVGVDEKVLQDGRQVARDTADPGRAQRHVDAEAGGASYVGHGPDDVGGVEDVPVLISALEHLLEVGQLGQRRVAQAVGGGRVELVGVPVERLHRGADPGQACRVRRA